LPPLLPQGGAPLILAAGCGYAAMVANSPYTPRTIKQRVDDLEQRVERLERAR